MANKVLLIGWDAADWQVINLLLEKGHMPSLKSVMDRGVYGNMSTMNPPYSPMLWTSVATGKTPDKHGILGFTELSPDLQAIQPVTVTSRKVRALWNIFTNQGLKSNVVGWWPSFPAEPIKGHMVSNKFQKINLKKDAKSPFFKGTTTPNSLIKEIGDLRIHPAELTEAHILPFIPEAAKIDQEKDRRLVSLTKILSENSSLHATATLLMRTTEWDFTAVYYDFIDHLCHGFMKYHPPKLPNISKWDFNIFNQVINSAYRFQDMMLGRMLELIDKDTTIVIMSDHGYESGHKRILKMPKYPAAPALEHRQFGIFVAAGPELKKNEKVFGLNLIDVAPTLLHLKGLPIGRDMDGKVALDIFKNPKDPTYIDSWEDQPGDFGEHDKSLQRDHIADQQTMDQLIELGYIDKPEDKIEDALHRVACELKHNLARVYLGKKDLEKSKDILLELIKEKDPIKVEPFYMDLLTISLLQKEFDKAQEYLDYLKTAKTELKFKTELVEAKILANTGKLKQGLKLLEETASKRRSADLWYHLGVMQTRSQHYKKSIVSFRKAIEIEQDRSKFYQALANSLVRTGVYQEAAELALKSIELVKFFPKAHYTLGEALEKMGDTANAKLAYETAHKLKPKTFKKAQLALENTDFLLQQSLQENTVYWPYREDQIIIVSGLPRSGTSLMMQMLDSNGLSILTDHKRKSDKNNPKGYFEYQPVMSINKDNKWVDLAQGKVVKVVAPLLRYLPKKYRYKVIFMNRDLNEIIKSQQKMRGRDPETLPIRLLNAQQKQLQLVQNWQEAEPGVEMLHVDFKQLVASPMESLETLEDFIGIDLDKQAMATCVDPKLYRNKA